MEIFMKYLFEKLLCSLVLLIMFTLSSCSNLSIDSNVDPGNDKISALASWSSGDRWASWPNGGYTLYNNIWGSGYGPQTIWANWYGNWGVWANHPNTGGIKSYPNCERVINKTVSSLGKCQSWWDVTIPGSGAYNASYDIWCNGYTFEIMLWFVKQGAVGPIGTKQYANQTIGWNNWDVNKGSNGANQVFSFIRTSNLAKGSVDIKAILNWIISKKWFGNVTLSKVQCGWEITSSSGGLNFQFNNYGVDFN
jgi:hypothetical protein